MQTATTTNQTQYRVRINQYIRVPQVRVILSDGTNGGIMDTCEALKLARNENLGSVEINPKISPPVVRIIDFGKMKYEEKKKQQAAKKNQIVQELKELTFRPNTDEHDISRLVDQAKGFLADGNRVIFSVKFRGREITHQNIGREKLEFVVKELSNFSFNLPQISLDGKKMSVIILPIKTK